MVDTSSPTAEPVEAERRRKSSTTSSGYSRPIGSFKLRSPSQATAIAPALFRQQTSSHASSPSASFIPTPSRSRSSAASSNASTPTSWGSASTQQRRKSMSGSITSVSTSRTAGYESVSTGVVSTSRVVKRLVVHGKVESSGTAGRKGCLFDVYLKLAVPRNISTDQVIPLFSQSPSELLAAELHPITSDGIAPDASSAVLNGATALGVPLASPFSSGNGDTDRQEVQVSVVQQGDQVGLAVRVENDEEDELENIDDSFRDTIRAKGNDAAGNAEYILALKIFAPFIGSPPRQAYSVSLPLPACLVNSLFFALPRLEDTEYDLSTSPSLRPFPPPALRTSSSSSSASSAGKSPYTLGSLAGSQSPFNKDVEDIVSGSFVSTEALSIRWVERPSESNTDRGRNGLYGADNPQLQAELVSSRIEVQMKEELIGVNAQLDVRWQGVTCMTVHPQVQLDVLLQSGEATSWNINRIAGGALIRWEDATLPPGSTPRQTRKPKDQDESSQPMRATFSRNESSSVDELRSLLVRKPSTSPVIERQPSSGYLMDTPAPFPSANDSLSTLDASDVTMENAKDPLVGTAVRKKESSMDSVAGGKDSSDFDARIDNEEAKPETACETRRIRLTLDTNRIYPDFELSFVLSKAHVVDDAEIGFELPRLVVAKATEMREHVVLLSPEMAFVESSQDTAESSIASREVREKELAYGTPARVILIRQASMDRMAAPSTDTRTSTPTTAAYSPTSPRIGVSAEDEPQGIAVSQQQDTAASASGEKALQPNGSAARTCITSARYTVSRASSAGVTYTELEVKVSTEDSKLELVVSIPADEVLEVLSAFVDGQLAVYEVSAANSDGGPDQHIRELGVRITVSLPLSTVSARHLYLVYTLSSSSALPEAPTDTLDCLWRLPTFGSLVGSTTVRVLAADFSIQTSGFDIAHSEGGYIVGKKFGRSRYTLQAEGQHAFVRFLSLADEDTGPMEAMLHREEYAESYETSAKDATPAASESSAILRDPLALARYAFILLIFLFAFHPLFMPNTQIATTLRNAYTSSPHAVEMPPSAGQVETTSHKSHGSRTMLSRYVGDVGTPTAVATTVFVTTTLTEVSTITVTSAEAALAPLQTTPPPPFRSALSTPGALDYADDHTGNYSVSAPFLQVDLQEYYRMLVQRPLYEVKDRFLEWYNTMKALLNRQFSQ